MKKTVALGISKFEDMINRDVFYIDKTYFIKEWWDSKDQVTLITRPRRFGKTLTLSMTETFFSNKYKDKSILFEPFKIWNDEKYRKIQGSYPVINLSFADVKQLSYYEFTEKIKRMISVLYRSHDYLLGSDKLNEDEKQEYAQIAAKKASDAEYMESVFKLSEYLSKHFGKNVLILIDEYDTPMLEAYTAGYWEEAIRYIRRMFHAAFKDNPYLERGLLTGITRITQESVFSDLNNLQVVTTTTKMYESCFGFTEDEVFQTLEEYGLDSSKEKVKYWYDGFKFGNQSDMYNPWSILNFLKQKEFAPYWINTSSNELVGTLIREGMIDVKKDFEILLNGGEVCTELDESITYAELSGNSKAVWSWLVTTGYLKIDGCIDEKYKVSLTNYEVKIAFYKLVKKWFDPVYNYYNNFIEMLLKGDVEGIQYYMSDVTENVFSYFDVGNSRLEKKTEQFYHGFTLGLIADLNRTHFVRSNRESGFGRYDICIEPYDKWKDGIIIEFKVFDEKQERSLQETGKRALQQIEEKKYENDLKSRGIQNIRKYGFAFHGKEVMVVEGH